MFGVVISVSYYRWSDNVGVVGAGGTSYDLLNVHLLDYMSDKFNEYMNNIKQFKFVQ